MNIDSVTLHKGDTLDFVVDINSDLNNDQHLWKPVIHDVSDTAASVAAPGRHWDAEKDFAGPAPRRLNRWEQIAQVLLISNELMFVD